MASDPLLPLVLLVAAWAVSRRAPAVGPAPAPAQPGAPGAPAGDPSINPGGGVGGAPYGPALTPEFTAQTTTGLTIAYATRDLYSRPIPVDVLPSYNVDPQQITTPITDAIGAVVGWLIPLRAVGSGWGTMDPGGGNVAV